MSRWYYTPDNKQRFGPLTAEQLGRLALSGAVRPEYMVMREGGGKWVPAAKVKGLFPEASHRADEEAASTPPPERARRKEPIVALALSLALVLLLGLGAGLVSLMSGGRPGDRGGADKVAVVGRRGTAKPAPAADESKREKGENRASRTKPERDADRPEEPADKAPENPVRKLPEKLPKQPPTQPQPEKGDTGSGEARTRPAEKPVDSFDRLGQALGDLNNRPAKKGKPAKEGTQEAGAKRDNPGPAKDQEGDGSRAEGTGAEVIKDPAKARLRARELMRKVRIEFDGRITGTRGDEASAKEVLGELIRTCPETGEADQAKLFLKHIGRMEAARKNRAKDGKLLDLTELVAKESAQREELSAAARSGNPNDVTQLSLDHAVERASWDGSAVVGLAGVVSVTGGSAVLVVRGGQQQMRPIHAAVKDNADPVFGRLRQGDLVEVRGTLEYRYKPLGGDFTVKDCVFTLKSATIPLMPGGGPH
jgi:hypothetical protein